MREINIIPLNKAIRDLFLDDPIPENIEPLYEVELEKSIAALECGNLVFLQSRKRESEDYLLPLDERGVSDSDLKKLLCFALEKVCNNVINHYLLYSSVVCNVNVFPEPWTHLDFQFIDERNPEIKGLQSLEIIKLKDVPEDVVYLLPPPEYLGIFTHRSGAAGAFCIVDSIIKIPTSQLDLRNLNIDLKYIEREK